MQNLRLLELLESVLGTSRKTAKGNYSFFCPFPGCKHDKRKMEIDLTPKKSKKNRWHCWRCDNKGNTIPILFKRIQVSQPKIDEAKKLTNDYRPTETKEEVKNTTVYLPKEYKPLWEPSISFEYKNALHYATKRRKLTIYDIIKHKIGYCETGEYARKLIFPSYDAEGKLNFFTARSYYVDDDDPHKNPGISKDIIGFDLFVNWNLPVTIVEGPMDAVTVRRNVIPLFGKNILKSLKQKIISRQPPGVYIALDPDALKKATKITEDFMKEGINVHLVDMNGQDPNKMGFEQFHKLQNNSPKLDFMSLVKLKMKLNNI